MIQEGTLEQLDAIGKWSERFEELYGRIAHFARSESRYRAKRYLLGLLGTVERKNGWHLAEATGETNPQGTQRLLNSADWDADAVRDDLRQYVVEHLGDEQSGVLIVDETGFLKKGTKSVGVARQYTGTAGDTVNCQVGVFLAYASNKGVAFIDRTLYLPEEWVKDQNRRAEAGVPREVVFKSKIEQAEEMLDRAFEARVPSRWVVADSFYGRSGAFRDWLEERWQPYAVMMTKTNAVPLDGRKKKIEQLVEQLPKDAYSEIRPAGDTGERRPWQWACIERSEDEDAGMRRWLLVRCGYEDPSDIAYWLAYGPSQTPTSELVRVCDARWTIEECFSQAKGEVGLDQYEVRRWDAWHRYITLCLLAHAFLTVTRFSAHTEESGSKGGFRTWSDPANCARGPSVGARDGRAQAAKTLPARVVDLQTSASGCGRTLQEGKPRRQTRSPRARIVRGAQRAGGYHAALRGSAADRCRMESDRADSPTTEVDWWTAVP